MKPVDVQNVHVAVFGQVGRQVMHQVDIQVRRQDRSKVENPVGKQVCHQIFWQVKEDLT